jgi:putative peptide zinc metalloprotease protein
VDDSADRRFERILWWLIALLLLLALLLTGSNFIPGPAWAEMPADRALLTVERGQVVALVDGVRVNLTKGSRLYVGETDSVQVQGKSRGRLTFRGGSAALLCAGSDTRVGPLWSDQVRPTKPSGSLELVDGRMLADTASTSGAFTPLNLTVTNQDHKVINEGAAWYQVASGDATVSTGVVTVDGGLRLKTGEALSCGDGSVLPRPSGSPSESGSPSVVPSPLPSPSPSPSPSQSPTPGQIQPPTPAQSSTSPSTSPSRSPSPSPSKSSSPSPTSPSPSTSTSPPRDTTPPTVSGANANPATIYDPTCQTSTTSTISATVDGVDDSLDAITAYFTYTIGGVVSEPVSMPKRNGAVFSGTLGPFSSLNEGSVTIFIDVYAQDDAGNVSKPPASTSVTWSPFCPIG